MTPSRTLNLGAALRCLCAAMIGAVLGVAFVCVWEACR